MLLIYLDVDNLSLFFWFKTISAPSIELAILEVIHEIEAVVGSAALWAYIMLLAPFLIALVGLFCEDYATRLV